jgi:hypothetical protein
MASAKSKSKPAKLPRIRPLERAGKRRKARGRYKCTAAHLNDINFGAGLGVGSGQRPVAGIGSAPGFFDRRARTSETIQTSAGSTSWKGIAYSG